MVTALIDRGENVCSNPETLTKEIENLSNVLCDNNYPQLMIDKHGISYKNGPQIHPDT